MINVIIAMVISKNHSLLVTVTAFLKSFFILKIKFLPNNANPTPLQYDIEYQILTNVTGSTFVPD